MCELCSKAAEEASHEGMIEALSKVNEKINKYEEKLRDLKQQKKELEEELYGVQDETADEA